jgi:hypothetical protein
MKAHPLVTAVAAVATFLGTANVVAQPPPQPQGQQQPAPVVELLACTFNAGKNMSDLRAASKRFNTWADQNAVSNYTAITLTPYVFSNQLKADALWLGAWPNGAGMGTTEAKWFATGAQTLAALEATIKCTSRALYAAIVLRTPPAPAPERDSLTMFRDCKIREGRTAPEAITALRQWSDYMAGRGSAGFDAVLFPLGGASPDAGGSFKSVHGFASVEEMGRGIDLYTTGGVQMQNQILGRVVDCNSPRVYLAERVRAAAPQRQ